MLNDFYRKKWLYQAEKKKELSHDKRLSFVEARAFDKVQALFDDLLHEKQIDLDLHDKLSAYAKDIREEYKRSKC